MVVVFKHYRGHIDDPKKQEYYRRQLLNIGKFKNKLSWLNVCYNNPSHGQLVSFPDVYQFLYEIQQVARSEEHVLQIHGSEHLDPSYHVTYNMATFDYVQSQFPQVKDTYITISVNLGVNNTSALSPYTAIMPDTKYHLIVGYPTVNPATNLGFVDYNC